MRSNNDRLVLCTIAPGGFYNSLYGGPGFDVAHISFDTIPPDFDISKSMKTFSFKGFKHHILYNILNTHWPEVFNKYKYIWLPDYDVDFGTVDDIVRLFDEAESNDCNICQPSLSQDSFRSFELVVNRNKNGFRRTNFVEIMCPLFKSEVLKNLLWTLKITYSGWGQDIIWAKELKYEGLGIVDSVVVKHTKPVGSQHWQLPNRINADRELELVLELMGIQKDDWWPRNIV
jgi:hypothetical protein